MESLPTNLKEIIEDFSQSEGREKLELLLDYAEEFPPLPEWLRGRRDSIDQVHECMTPVFINGELCQGKMYFYFDVPAESPTIRGYASLLLAGLKDLTPEQIIGVPSDFYQVMGLHTVLSYQRLIGIAAILAHMKRIALEQFRGTAVED